jgi:hypothetical protein
MSKKQLLNEAQIRRFMTLANLEPLVKNVLSEADENNEAARRANQAPPRREPSGSPQESLVREEESPEAADASAGDDMVDVNMGAGDDSGGEADADKTAAFEAAVKALADSLGIEVEMGDSAGAEDAGGEDAGAEDTGAEDAGGEEAAPMEEGDYDMEEDMYEAKHKKAKKKEEEDEEDMDESVALSEDSLVEAVLARVTARLVAEAKKKKETPKQKMDRMKKEKEAAAKKKKALEEATESKGGGPLLKQGKNKYDTYKGHSDMEYSKGKEGKGGHEMETLSAKAEHSVTHGGKNLATLGGIKKK